MARVVQGLENDARRQGAIADHRDAMAVALAEQVIAGLEAQRRGDAATGVAGHEQVVKAFVRIGVAHETAACADTVELREAAGDELVRINLMTGVPDETVA